MRGAAGYLSLPCCAWAFDGRFARNAQTGAAGAPFAFLFAPRGAGVEDGGRQDEAAFVESLGLGSDATAASSAYAAYRVWLARLAVACGWEVEPDTLRIPSTRNWALVGTFCWLPGILVPLLPLSFTLRAFFPCFWLSSD
jgi:tRNASer (uridine44-2'-O)-methyltransferase